MRNRFSKKQLCHMYRSLMDYKCASPDCGSGLNAEAHHIRPLSKGGEDKNWNLICLCSKCHHPGLHKNWEDWQTELYTYKCIQESEILGFYLDENDEYFKENFKKAILIRERRELYEK